MKVLCAVSVGRLRMCLPFIQNLFYKIAQSIIYPQYPDCYRFLNVLRFFDRMLAFVTPL